MHLRTITAHSVAKDFCDHWVFSYDPLVYFVKDNRQQCKGKLFQAVCRLWEFEYVYVGLSLTGEW